MDEIAKLIIQVEGQQQVKVLEKAIEQEAEALHKLIAAHGQHDAAVKASAQVLLGLQRDLTKAEQAVGGVTNKLAGLGQVGLQTGRVVQDFAQGGVAGIINNVEGLAQAFGGGPGLAGALTLVATGFLVLKPLVTEWINQMGLFEDSTQKAVDVVGTLQKRIKELEDKPIKLTADVLELQSATAELKKMQEGARAYQAALQGKTEEEVEAGAGVSYLLAKEGIGGRRAIPELKGARVQQLIAASPTIQAVEPLEKELAAAQEFLKTAGPSEAEGAESVVKTLQERVDRQRELASQVRLSITKVGGIAETQVGNIITAATSGIDPEATQELAGMLAGVGRKTLASNIAGTTPEAIEAAADAQRKDDRAEEARKEAYKVSEVRRKKVQAAREKAGQEAEQDPETKRRQAENIRKFGGMGLEGTAKEAAERQQREMIAKEVAADQRAQREEKPLVGASLARQIFQKSEAMTGVQFTPEQAMEAAKKSLEMQQQQVPVNEATIGAMGEVLQGMVQLANQLQQQQAFAMQFAGQAGQFRRQMQMNGPTNLNMGEP